MENDFELHVDPLSPCTDCTVIISHEWGTIKLTLGGLEYEYNLADVIGSLVRPALIASGYGEDVVSKYVVEVY